MFRQFISESLQVSNLPYCLSWYSFLFSCYLLILNAFNLALKKKPNPKNLSESHL